MVRLIVSLFFVIPYTVFAQSETVHIDALVPGCGNSVIEAGESCDGLNLAGQSCRSLGFSSGTLTCANACTFVTAGCVANQNNRSESTIRNMSLRPITEAVFVRGVTSPFATVWLLRDGGRYASIESGPDGLFTFSLKTFPAGVYMMGLYSESTEGLRSSVFPFPVQIGGGGINVFENFMLAPTINIEESRVAPGDDITVYGEAAPHTQVTVALYKDGRALLTATASTTSKGKYEILVPSISLMPGSYTALTYSATTSRISAPSRVLTISVGDFSVPRYRDFDVCPYVRGDLNSDCRVNILDTLRLLEMYRNTTLDSRLEFERLNGDRKIDMRDFGILFYNWTG